MLKLARDIKNLPKADGRWLFIWFMIYVSFLLLDIFFPDYQGTAILKYAGIFLCVVYAYQKYHSDTALILALLFTFLADTILVWTRYEIMGVFCFCIAQSAHLIRLNRKYAANIKLLALVLSLIVIAALLLKAPAIYVIACAYIILLFTNFILAIKDYHKNKANVHSRYGFYGFLLFICCDIYVGTRHLILDGLIGSAFLPLVNYLVWVFYYPSQVLIANSSDKEPTPLKHPSIKLQKQE
jgi:hypothetical protein